MDLFVIQREQDDHIAVTEEVEKLKLEKVLKQIEKRKKQRIRQREREKEKQNIIQKTVQEREQKRRKKESLVPVPYNKIDEFIEEPAPENNNEQTTTPKQDSIKIEGFTILGAKTSQNKTKVKRVLPKWLSTPVVISSNLQELQCRVSKLEELDPCLKKQLKANGIKYLFPVQAEVIPWLLKVNRHTDVVFPQDLCVSAPTGSGKTLAFVIPIVQMLKRHTVRKVRALVILPTQDLAAQIFKTFKTYTKGTNLEVCLITGKNLFNLEQKQLIYCNKTFGCISKVDILVCTAGRLVDHLKFTPAFNLQSLEFLVIDEADRVLENVQDDWLYHLEKHLHQKDSDQAAGKVLNLFSLQKQRPPQKLLFSATLSQDPEKLQKLSLFQPKLFTSVVENDVEENKSATFIGKYTTPKELSENYIVCSKNFKPLVLYKFIKTEKLRKTLIFTHSIETAHRLTILLKSLFKEKLKIEEVSSSLKGKGRDELISRFAQDKIDLLICTDALARGIDLPSVQCVISYSAPKHLKTYIHRAGRTARAGEYGLAVTLLHQEQLQYFKYLLNQSKKKDVNELEISEEDLEPLSKLYKKSLSKLKETVQNEERTGLKKILSVKKTIKLKKKTSISK